VATLVDTNILLRSLNPDDPQYEAAANALAKLRVRNETLCIVPQNLIEFWAVATRPINKNGLGMHAVTDILTFNVSDFRRFPGITALDPAVV
jgi:hypothetical protein